MSVLNNNDMIEDIKNKFNKLEEAIDNAELDNIINIESYNKIKSKLEIVGNIIYKL